MSDQDTGKENQQQKDQKTEIEDLAAEDADATQVKGGVGIIQKAGGGN